MNEHLSTTLTVYYSILLSMIFCFSSYWLMPSNRLVKIQQKSIFYDIRFWIPCILYTVLLGFRWDFAFDWWQYYQTFEYIQRGQLYRETTEKGYLLINFLLGKAGLNYYSIFLLECFTFFTSIFLLLKHNRKGLLIGLCFVFIAMRFRCLNLSRQHFAMSVLWIGFYFLLKNKVKSYLLFAFLACSIHTSAILWIIPFYLSRYIHKFLNFKIALIVFISCYVLKTVVFDFLINASSVITAILITNKSYDASAMLADNFMWEEQSPMRMTVNFIKGIAYIVCMYYCLNQKRIKDSRDYIILVLGYIGLCITVFGTTHEIISRFMLYFSVFTFLGWGIIWVHIWNDRHKVSPYILFLAIITLLHYFYSMYPTIISEFESHIYIEYKWNTLSLFK